MIWIGKDKNNNNTANGTIGFIQIGHRNIDETIDFEGFVQSSMGENRINNGIVSEVERIFTRDNSPRLSTFANIFIDSSKMFWRSPLEKDDIVKTSNTERNYGEKDNKGDDSIGVYFKVDADCDFYIGSVQLKVQTLRWEFNTGNGDWIKSRDFFNGTQSNIFLSDSIPTNTLSVRAISNKPGDWITDIVIEPNVKKLTTSLYEEPEFTVVIDGQTATFSADIWLGSKMYVIIDDRFLEEDDFVSGFSGENDIYWAYSEEQSIEVVEDIDLTKAYFIYVSPEGEWSQPKRA